MSESVEVVVIGAGLAGLTCALELSKRGVDVRVLEASDAVGGRVKTDEHEGYLLDHGFQVLLTAYPHAQMYLDYDELDLCPFFPGSLIRTPRGFARVADPFREPAAGLQTLWADVGTLRDKLRVGAMRAELATKSLEQIFSGDEVDTLSWLQQRGFSQGFIDEFFRPFYGGVMLDRELETSSKMLEFTYKMFAAGDTAIPRRGMGQLTKQLAQKLGDDRITLGARVTKLTDAGVELADGAELHADQVVIATHADFAAAQLDEVPETTWRSVSCVYFSADEAPITAPILVLAGDNAGPINNLCVPSLISSDYAPSGKHLISVSVLGHHTDRDNDALERAIRTQASAWFGSAQVTRWRHLRTYHIEHAQPNQDAGKLSTPARAVKIDPRLFVCGDHRETASIDGAMSSGRRAALALLEERARATKRSA